MEKTKLCFVVLMSLSFSFLAFSLVSAVDSDTRLDPSLNSQIESGKVVKAIVNIRDLNGNVPSNVGALSGVLGLLDDGKIEKTFSTGAFVATLNSKDIEVLLGDERVYRIEEIKSLGLSLQDAVQIVDADQAWEKEIDSVPLDGTRQSVCVIDTGVDFSHGDLASKNILGCNLNCFYPDDCFLNCSSSDFDGHGTHVAGIAGAAGDIFGIGRGVDIISAKVFVDGSEETSSLDVAQAIFWCVDNAEEYNISVISASIASDADQGYIYETYCNNDWPFFEFAIDVAHSNNISFVAASGNDGNSSAITAPACIEQAIPVSATHKDDSVWSGSNYNGLVKLFAPGVGINSTVIGGNYGLKTGTSMSTPMVAASIAILNQFVQGEGYPATRTPEQFENILFDSGQIIDIGGDVFSRVNVNDALLSIDYLVPDVVAVSPFDQANFIAKKGSTNIDFVCESSDWQLSTLTLKIIDSNQGSVVFEEMRDVSGEASVEEQFSVSLGVGDYDWYCESSDLKDNLGVSGSNHLTVSRFSFGVPGSLISPRNVTRINP